MVSFIICHDSPGKPNRPSCTAYVFVALAFIPNIQLGTPDFCRPGLTKLLQGFVISLVGNQLPVTVLNGRVYFVGGTYPFSPNFELSLQGVPNRVLDLLRCFVVLCRV